MSKVDTRLTRNLNPGQRVEFDADWNATSVMRRKLAEVLTEELNSVIMDSEKVDLLNSPNALAVIAQYNGKRDALRGVIKLINPSETP